MSLVLDVINRYMLYMLSHDATSVPQQAWIFPKRVNRGGGNWDSQQCLTLSLVNLERKQTQYACFAWASWWFCMLSWCKTTLHPFVHGCHLQCLDPGSLPITECVLGFLAKLRFPWSLTNSWYWNGGTGTAPWLQDTVSRSERGCFYPC